MLSLLDEGLQAGGRTASRRPGEGVCSYLSLSCRGHSALTGAHGNRFEMVQLRGGVGRRVTRTEVVSHFTRVEGRSARSPRAGRRHPRRGKQLGLLQFDAVKSIGYRIVDIRGARSPPVTTPNPGRHIRSNEPRFDRWWHRPKIDLSCGDVPGSPAAAKPTITRHSLRPPSMQKRNLQTLPPGSWQPSRRQRFKPSRRHSSITLPPGRNPRMTSALKTALPAALLPRASGSSCASRQAIRFRHSTNQLSAGSGGKRPHFALLSHHDHQSGASTRQITTIVADANFTGSLLRADRLMGWVVVIEHDAHRKRRLPLPPRDT